MKKVILILILISFTICCKAQMLTNELTTVQFNNIKINGILKTVVEATEGDITQMESLFGEARITEGEEGIGDGWRIFIFDEQNLTIGFTNLNSSESNAEIEGFEANNITINDVTIHLGDNIAALGPDIVFNYNTNGTKSIIFTHLFYDCCPIIIEYNQLTNTITKIEYVVFS